MATTYFYDIENVTEPAIVGFKGHEKEVTHKSIGKTFSLESINK